MDAPGSKLPFTGPTDWTAFLAEVTKHIEGLRADPAWKKVDFDRRFQVERIPVVLDALLHKEHLVGPLARRSQSEGHEDPAP